MRPKRCHVKDCPRRAARRGLCRAHYDVEPRARAPAGSSSRLPTMTVPAEWLRCIGVATERSQTTPASWIRAAIRRALLQEAWTDPELRALLLAAGEEPQ